MMASHPNRSFYALHSPRGFPPEAVVHVFASRAARDAWVTENEESGDGGRKGAKRGTRAIPSKYARSIRDDDFTKVNIHDDGMVYRKFDEAIKGGDARTIDNFVEIEVDEWHDRMESEEPDEHDFLYDSMPCCLLYLGRPPGCGCRVNPDDVIPF